MKATNWCKNAYSAFVTEQNVSILCKCALVPSMTEEKESKLCAVGGVFFVLYLSIAGQCCLISSGWRKTSNAVLKNFATRRQKCNAGLYLRRASFPTRRNSRQSWTLCSRLPLRGCSLGAILSPLVSLRVARQSPVHGSCRRASSASSWLCSHSAAQL